MLRGGPFTLRRRILLALLLLVVALLGWSAWMGMAITQGLEQRQMDWNGDGVTTGEEIWQAVHAVRVENSTEGQRQCQTFLWWRSGEVIRVECRTVFGQE